MTITLKANNENEMRFFEKGLKEQASQKQVIACGQRFTKKIIQNM